MNPVRTAAVICSAAAVPMLLAIAAGPAIAGNSVGTCTKSYGTYSHDNLLAFDPGAEAIFPVIDANGDGYICFKAYPNGPHAGHEGNLVDNNAAPHQ